MEIIVLIVAVLIAAAVFVWTVFTLISEISAVAFVPSEIKSLEKIFNRLKLKPGKKFADLGSGDGRVAAMAFDKFKLKSFGFEINPWLIIYSKLRYRNVEFILQSLWKTDLTKFDYIYCYLSPRAVERLARRLEKENIKKVMIISKAFEIKSWKNKLYKTITESDRNYYVYKF